jgi:hypothetical protein
MIIMMNKNVARMDSTGGRAASAAQPPGIGRASFIAPHLETCQRLRARSLLGKVILVYDFQVAIIAHVVQFAKERFPVHQGMFMKRKRLT